MHTVTMEIEQEVWGNLSNSSYIADDLEWPPEVIVGFSGSTSKNYSIGTAKLTIYEIQNSNYNR